MTLAFGQSAPTGANDPTGCTQRVVGRISDVVSRNGDPGWIYLRRRRYGSPLSHGRPARVGFDSLSPLHCDELSYLGRVSHGCDIDPGSVDQPGKIAEPARSIRQWSGLGGSGRITAAGGVSPAALRSVQPSVLEKVYYREDSALGPPEVRTRQHSLRFSPCRVSGIASQNAPGTADQPSGEQDPSSIPHSRAIMITARYEAVSQL